MWAYRDQAPTCTYCGRRAANASGHTGWALHEGVQLSWRVDTEIYPAFTHLAKLCTLGGAASAQRKEEMPFSTFPKCARRFLPWEMVRWTPSKRGAATWLQSIVTRMWPWGNEGFLLPDLPMFEEKYENLDFYVELQFLKFGLSIERILHR